MLRVVCRFHIESSELLFEKDLGHHAFVLMAQQMTVEERYATDDGIGEVHHKIDISFNRDIDCIQPFWAFEPNSVLGVDEEVNLMDVERVHLVRFIRDEPVMKSADGYRRHRWVRWCEFPPVDVEAFFVLGKMNNKVRRAILCVRNQGWRQGFRVRNLGADRSDPRCGVWLCNVYHVRQHHRRIEVSITARIKAKRSK